MKGRDASVASDRDLPALLNDIRACRLCAAHLPLGPRPIVQAATTARLMIVGQAPGARVHASGIPWDDASGERLRAWLGLPPTVFYDPAQVALASMGLCYPGRGGGGDLPPRKECAPQWMARLRAQLPEVALTLLIGRHAQRWFLGAANRASLTETVAAFADYGPRFLPLPHPSPRNTAWFQRHAWFEREVLPALRQRIERLLPCAPAAGGAQELGEDSSRAAK